MCVCVSVCVYLSVFCKKKTVTLVQIENVAFVKRNFYHAISDLIAIDIQISFRMNSFDWEILELFIGWNWQMRWLGVPSRKPEQIEKNLQCFTYLQVLVICMTHVKIQLHSSWNSLMCISCTIQLQLWSVFQFNFLCQSNTCILYTVQNMEYQSNRKILHTHIPPR